MTAVVSRLQSQVGAEFGDGAATPKFHADEIDPDCALPYLLHTGAEETPERFFGGRVGSGAFELGVFSAGYVTSETLLEAVREALETWALPFDLADGGRLFFLRSITDSARSLTVPAPGSGVTHYGRTQRFHFKVSRSAV